MNCADARDALGSTGQREELAADVREHLETCADCRQLSEEYGRLDSDLAALYDSGFEPGMLEATLAGLEEKPRRRSRAGRWLVAAAAAALLVAGGAWSAHHFLSSGARFEPYELAVAENQPGAFDDVEGARIWARAASRAAVTAPRRLRLSQGALHVKVAPGRGGFMIEVPDGTVSVLGTEFSVRVAEEATRVAVRSGQVRIANASGTLELPPGEAGSLPRRRDGISLAAPASLPGVSVASETLWRRWEWLDAAERAERLAHLRALLSLEDYEARVRARKLLTEAGGDGLTAAVSWTTAKSPRLRLEAVLFLRGAPADHAAARAALKKVAGNRGEQPGIRSQADLSLDELDARLRRKARPK